jgi:hypothetical protein
LTGATSSSSSKLPLDATLESALITFDDMFSAGDAPISMVELGVSPVELVELTTPAEPLLFEQLVLLLGWLLLLLFVALGVLLLCPRELEVESGMSSEGSSHP